MAVHIAAIIGIVLGLIGLGIDFVEMVPFSLVVSDLNPVARSVPGALIWYVTYFTHLTNIGLVLVYLAVLTRWRWLGWFTRPVTQALIGGHILLVMIYYHFMLAGLYPLEGAMLVATYLLHYVTPIWYLVWWGVFARHGSLAWRDIPWMLVPGLVYVAWALGRGAITGEYPYTILDPTTLGYVAVAIGIGTLVVAVVIFCAAMVGADKLIARYRRGAA